MRRLLPLLLLPALGYGLAGCGNGGGQVSRATDAAATRPEVTATLPERTQPATTSATTAPTPPETLTREETQTAVVTHTSTVSSTVTTGVSSGTVAVAGAAVATQQADTSDETDWGWIAFALLAAAVAIFGIVWWVRKRHTTKPAT
jgi:F0F1-type ATP synthase membrane subunit c/vacuolar-type H+-ATPase subunit K